MKPLLLLDIDGVICPMESDQLDGYQTVAGLYEHERVSMKIASQLQALLSSFELVWCTSWGEDANDSMSPALGLPPLRQIDLAKPGPTDLLDSYKFAQVKAFVGDRPMVWIDDMLYDDVDAWAESRAQPTLLIRTDPLVGLTDEHFERLATFLTESSVPNEQPDRDGTVLA